MSEDWRAAWNEHYAGEGYVFGTEPNDFLRATAGRIPRGEVLCLGEGEGRNAVYLARLGHRVTAVDFAEKGLAKALALAVADGVSIETIVADLSEFAIEPGSFDGIVSIFCHLPSSIRTRLYPACVAGLRPGGVFILEAYNSGQMPRTTGGPKNPDLLVELAPTLADLKGLTIEIGREVEREVIEGHGHTGLSSVTQILATKPA